MYMICRISLKSKGDRQPPKSHVFGLLISDSVHKIFPHSILSSTTHLFFSILNIRDVNISRGCNHITTTDEHLRG